MQVEVIHSAFSDAENPRTVAIVDASDFTDVNDALEYAYRWTNNVMGSWSIKEDILKTRNGGMIENGDYNPNVTRMVELVNGGMGLRSTSEGDHMIVDGKKYKVASFGFDLVE